MRRITHRLSTLFQPQVIVPQNAEIKHQDLTSKSQKLMLELGIIKQANPGCFHWLPIGVKALEKLEKLADEEMKNIGGQKIMLPTLTNAKLWAKSGRLKGETSAELFHIKDRHNHHYILNPTHEEAVTELVATLAPISYKKFPLKLYQITSKFRDEMKPRFGLMRGRQFIMKDMYSFDVSLDNAQISYKEICQGYDNFFQKLGVDFIKVLGTTGEIGGLMSHEYHFLTNVGEDRIVICHKCDYKANVQLSGEKCGNCGSTDVNIHTGVEVGHTFLLGDKYSKPLKAMYLSKEGKSETLQMGCYGLGISRILAASLECLSNEKEIRWPTALAPFKVIILPPKEGSKEESVAKDLAEKLYLEMENMEFLKDEVLLDDRNDKTIGKRHLDAMKMGYPFIVALGKKIIENPPLFELTDLRSKQQLFLSKTELLDYLNKNISH